MKRVLLVEDDSLFRKSLAKLIGSQGFSVEEAASGEEGLRVFETEGADVVLLDYDLPGISGLEVARRLRGRSSQVPIIILSATLPEEARIAAQTEHIGPILRKSHDNLATLIPVITRIFESGQSEAAR